MATGKIHEPYVFSTGEARNPNKGSPFPHNRKSQQDPDEIYEQMQKKADTMSNETVDVPTENPMLGKTTKALDLQTGGNHYKSLGIQPVEYIHANSLTYLEGNVIKYVTRHAAKGKVIDLEKAKHYIDLIIQMKYGESQ